APVVDDQQIYIPGANSRFYAFYLPFVSARDAEAEGGTGLRKSAVYGTRDPNAEVRPTPVWEEETNIELSFKPVQTADTVFGLSRAGQALGFSKVLREGGTSTLAFRFSTDGKIRVPMGQYGDTAYIGSEDSALYAVSLTSGKLRWRHSAGAAVRHR